MKRLIVPITLIVCGALGGCSSQTPSLSDKPLPPSREVKTKNEKSKVVADEMPPPPVRQKQ